MIGSSPFTRAFFDDTQNRFRIGAGNLVGLCLTVASTPETACTVVSATSRMCPARL